MKFEGQWHPGRKQIVGFEETSTHQLGGNPYLIEDNLPDSGLIGLME
ncbi:hypothetical protein HDE79_000669 [Rhodanobacter sp. MP1X3]|jgi:hypothetical protein|nr:hypothetical protein [Rhodanobacter sp. MP1X3]